jgi:hypothetical protein
MKNMGAPPALRLVNQSKIISVYPLCMSTATIIDALRMRNHNRPVLIPFCLNVPIKTFL